MIKLARGPEFDRIRAIARQVGSDAALGDDCAILPAGEGRLALSTDVSVAGVHFLPGWLSWEEVGWKSSAAALADLAAMAARPLAVVAAVTIPPSLGDGPTAAIMKGVDAAARAAGCAVVGGDLSRGSELSIAVTVLGRVTEPVGRDGARPGDRLWVTGALGGAATAVAAWRAGEVPDPSARAAFAAPVPRIQAGEWLGNQGARAMLDLSDGLGADAAQLAAASGVQCTLEIERVPVHPGVLSRAVRLGLEPVVVAAQGGEDYELLVALGPDFGDEQARAFEQSCSLALTRVGTVRRGRGVVSRLRGERIVVPVFDHFA